MSNNSGTEAAVTLDSSRFVTEKVSDEGGVMSGSTGGSPASKHSSTGGGGSGGGGSGGVECDGSDKPQATTMTTTAGTASTTITTNRGGVPDGNCSPGGAHDKGKERNSSARNTFTFIITSVRVLILILINYSISGSFVVTSCVIL
jgi:hypothetical protein